MALEKQVVIDKIEILEFGQIQIREVVRIVEDGNELSASYNRSSLVPEQDLTGQDPKVVAIANAVWTPEVIAAYKAMVEASKKPATE
jgi:hypothetical protein